MLLNKNLFLMLEQKIVVCKEDFLMIEELFVTHYLFLEWIQMILI